MGLVGVKGLGNWDGISQCLGMVTAPGVPPRGKHHRRSAAATTTGAHKGH